MNQNQAKESKKLQSLFTSRFQKSVRKTAEVGNTKSPSLRRMRNGSVKKNAVFDMMSQHKSRTAMPYTGIDPAYSILFVYNGCGTEKKLDGLN